MANKLGAPRSPRPSHGRRTGGWKRHAVGHLRGDRRGMDEHATGFDLINLMGVHEIAKGRTVVRDPHLCVSDNGQTARGTRGRGHVGWVSRGYGRILALARGAPTRPAKGRHILRKRIKSGLTVLGLGTIIGLSGRQGPNAGP
jgi:hypothetical protein